MPKGIRLDILICIILWLFAPLFFYKLGQSSLQSWDEAWYAEISRNILKSGDLFNLTWANKPYFDHPSFGFWMNALSFKIFGVSEFSARLMSAIFGLSSVLIIYLLGKELFNRTVGLLSALALPSATWFLYRSRTGNLDVYLETLFLLTLFLGIKLNQNRKFLVPFTISLSALFLTKTMVPFTILPALVVIFWNNKSLARKDILQGTLLFFVISGSWFLTQIIHQPGFINRYLSIGLPGVSVSTNHLENFKTAKEFLHEGVGKWYWPGVIALFMGPFLRQKRFLILSAFSLTFFIAFFFSSDIGIWHLIPLHPILILAFFGFFYTILHKFLKQKIIITGVLLLICIYFSFIQIRRSWYEFIDIPAYISDGAILSKAASNYPQKLYIEGEDFRPEAVFYSQKPVPQRVYVGSLPEMFSSPENFLMITYQRELDAQKVPQNSYKILKTDRDKILVLH